MPFTSGKPFHWLTESPLVFGPFIQGWPTGNPLPPPETDFIITEDSLFYVADEAGDNVITEF